MSGVAITISQKSKDTRQIRIAYTLPLKVETLKVRYSANAWWMDQGAKINLLITAFSIGATIKEACTHAGITLRQYKYFVFLHPEFSEIRELYATSLKLRARAVIAQAINSGDVKVSRWYLEKEDESWKGPSRKKNNGLLAWEQRKREQKKGLLIPGIDSPYPEDIKVVEEFQRKRRENQLLRSSKI